ncbi:MAG: HlyD family efflux transporter periplasmic adaptor subunit [Planctomycetota bacterium]
MLVLLVVGGGAVAAIARFMPLAAGPTTNVITHTVQRGDFEHNVVERGEVESSANVEVRCEVKARGSGGIAILDVIDEGTEVQAGDVLVQLDSATLEQELVQQQITCNTTEAQMVEARNTYEAAQIAKKEYIEGTFEQESQQIQSEIFIAEETLRKAAEYVGYSERLAARGYVTSQQLEGDSFAVEKAQTELDTAKTKLRVLQEYTKPKMLKQLDSDIKSAEARWKSEQSSYELETSKLKEIEEQITKCTLVAPQAGQVVYANTQGGRRESEFLVEAGALVRESQVLIRLPDPSKMQVKAKINESRVTAVREGMKATIRLDAFGDSSVPGEVVRVNEYPEPTSWYSSQVKEYATFVRIDETISGIRPGLTAEVTIHANARQDALLVPVQAVFEHGRRTFVALQQGETWEAREIGAPLSSQKFVVAEQGLAEGDVVAMNPRKLIDQLDLPEIEETPPPPPAKPAEQKRPASSSGGSNASAVVDMIYQRLDKNSDGIIAADEMPADQADRLKQSDRNGDGKIQKAEMLQAMQKMMSRGGGPPQ